MALKACATCARPFTPTLHGQRHCLTHQPRSYAARSPTTRAINTPEYKRHRAAILASNPPCWLCGQPGADTIDHVTPVSRGGTNHPTNLRPAHRHCNASKGNRPHQGGL